MTQPLRVLFAGTPEFAAVHLRALLDGPHTVCGVYTQPDRRAGRGKKLVASPVKAVAEAAGIDVYQPLSLRDPDAQATLASLAPDVMVVVAYGLILPQAVLDIPRLGCLNVHASLLPRWRGAAPIQRAIEAGDTESGVTIMQMEAGLDTGPMLKTAIVPIDPTMTGGALHDALAEKGPAALSAVLADLPATLASAEVQDDALANYAHKIEKADMGIDWRCDAAALARKIRAFAPTPGCYSALEGDRIKIWQATAHPGDQHDNPGVIRAFDRTGIRVLCGQGELLIERAQVPGGKPLSAAELLNGQRERFEPGRRFDPHPDA